MNHSHLQLDWPQPREFPALAADEVHVWAVPLDAGDLPENSLADAELARAKSFALDRPRRSFVTTRIALRSLLGRYLRLPPREVPIAFGPNGKPQLAAGDLHFNLTHSGELALIAITRSGPVGIDVEQLRKMTNALELAERNFHPRERAAIRAATDADRASTFLRCWTRKEAVIKALGVGIGHPLDTFDVLASDVLAPSSLVGVSGRCYLRDLHPSGAYVAAAATLHAPDAVSEFTYAIS